MGNYDPKDAQSENDGDLSGGRGDGTPPRDGMNVKEIAANPQRYSGQTRPRCVDKGED